MVPDVDFYVWESQTDNKFTLNLEYLLYVSLRLKCLARNVRLPNGFKLHCERVQLNAWRWSILYHLIICTWEFFLRNRLNYYVRTSSSPGTAHPTCQTLLLRSLMSQEIGVSSGGVHWSTDLKMVCSYRYGTYFSTWKNLIWRRENNYDLHLYASAADKSS